MKLTQKEIDAIVNLHNKFRAGELAANMQEMIWDPKLAGFAQEGSDNCDMAHRRDLRGFGENIHGAWNSEWRSAKSEHL